MVGEVDKYTSASEIRKVEIAGSEVEIVAPKINSLVCSYRSKPVGTGQGRTFRERGCFEHPLESYIPRHSYFRWFYVALCKPWNCDFDF
jgi:hypothetical protein